MSSVHEVEPRLKHVKVLVWVSTLHLQSIIDQLRREGAVVSWARSKSQAVRWIHQVRPHWVLTDADPEAWMETHTPNVLTVRPWATAEEVIQALISQGGRVSVGKKEAL